MKDGETGTEGLDRDLAQRLKRALTVGHEELYAVLKDPEMDVLRAALRNPALTETHLHTLLKRRELSEGLLKAICNSRFAKDSHSIRLALAHHPAMPAQQLIEILPHLYLFELVTISTLAGVVPDQKVAVERAIIQRLPTTPLGNKITLAHRGSAPVVENLLMEGDPRLMTACLENPLLKEGAVFKFLRSATASAEAISMIARHPRWQNRPNLKLAILNNPRTPLVWFTHWLPTLHRGDLRNLVDSQRLSQQQRHEVKAEITRRNQGG